MDGTEPISLSSDTFIMNILPIVQGVLKALTCSMYLDQNEPSILHLNYSSQTIHYRSIDCNDSVRALKTSKASSTLEQFANHPDHQVSLHAIRYLFTTRLSN